MMHDRRTATSLAGVVLATLALAAPSHGALRDDVEAWVAAHAKEIVAELAEAVSMPAVASDRDAIRKKAEWLRERFARRGFDAVLLPTDGNPLVYAELAVPGARRTLLLYAHYDGQPVDPARWAQADPFAPVLRTGRVEEGAPTVDPAAAERIEEDWRLYARSAADDTGPIVALLATVDALRAMGLAPTSSLRVVLDGEEEAGSPSLAPAVVRDRERLEADAMLILDGPLHPSDRPTLVYGARGILPLELTVYGPRVPLHSGHYGNWAPNPATRLARLLASMKDDEGRTTIEGFYDGIELTEAERAVLAAVPDDLAGLARRLGFAEPDAVGASLQEALQYPSLNVRGLASGWVGAAARTIVPDVAVAAIDVRLVKETPADVLYEKILRHIRGQGYRIVTEDPDEATRARSARIVKVVRGAGSEAYRTELDEPATAPLVEALAEMWGAPPVRIRTSGGTVPIAPFVRTLGVPAVSVPIVNFDNNQHSPNENLRLGHLFRGIVSFAAVLTMRP